mgnify:CR=1 FL=1
MYIMNINVFLFEYSMMKREPEFLDPDQHSPYRKKQDPDTTQEKLNISVSKLLFFSLK